MDKRQEELRAGPWWLAIGIGAIVAIILALRLFIFTPLVVYGDSMYPTFHSGDYIITEKVLPCCERGQVVVARAEIEGTQRNIVKRVAGVAGDEVEVRGGELWVNGERIEEPWRNTREGPGPDMLPTVVPDGEVFLLGDNRSTSIDSRRIGPVPLEDIRGWVIWRFWPLTR